MTTYRFFSIKNVRYNTNSTTSLKHRCQLMIRCQNTIVTVNVQSVHCWR